MLPLYYFLLLALSMIVISCRESVSKTPILRQPIATENSNKPETDTSTIRAREVSQIPSTNKRTVPQQVPSPTGLPPGDQNEQEKVTEPADNLEVTEPELVTFEPGTYLTAEEFLTGQATGMEQMKKICDRPGNDRIRKVFCSQGGADPIVDISSINSLRSFQEAIGFEIPSFEEIEANIQAAANAGAVDPAAEGAFRSGLNGTSFAFTVHSSSLVKSFTSPVNPRLVMFTSPVARPEDTELEALNIPDDVIAIGFVRGEQFVEIAAKDEDTGEINFFLLSFTQACNSRLETDGVIQGCTDTELLTEAIESNWTSVNLYEDIDLNNTVADCLRCHVVKDEAGMPKTIYRMQELLPTWTHWFSPNPEGQAMLNEFKAAYLVDGSPAERYLAGVPTQALSIDNSLRETPASFGNPAQLQNFVQQQTLSETQPNEFRGDIITEERFESGTSSFWQDIYGNFARGASIQVPYQALNVCTSDKLEEEQINRQNFFTNGTPLPKDSKHIYDCFSEEASQGMARTFAPTTSPETLLISACSSCHNPQQDQALSRARFTIDPIQLDGSLREMALKDLERRQQGTPEVLKTAIFRVSGLPSDHLNLMPPNRDHILSDTQKASLVNFLQNYIQMYEQP